MVAKTPGTMSLLEIEAPPITAMASDRVIALAMVALMFLGVAEG